MEIKQACGSGVQRVFGLISGRAGMGKTTQITTFPIEETLGISVEDGFLSIDGSGFAYTEIKSYDQLLGAIENIQTTAPWCKYLYIDSLTEIYDVLQHELKGKYKPSQNFQKHDEMQDKMMHIIRIARQLPISVFFTCHTKEDKDGMALIENLAFQGKLPAMVMKQFDLCVHLQSTDIDGQKQRVLVTSPEISHVAKRRVSPWLDTKVQDIEEPNLYKLTQKLMGKA